MRFLRQLVGAAVVFTGVALGPSAAQADECWGDYPDCWDTMGLCGAECGTCVPDGSFWGTAEAHCEFMCATYGGVVDSGEYGAGTLFHPYVLVVCECAQECPTYYE